MMPQVTFRQIVILLVFFAGVGGCKRTNSPSAPSTTGAPPTAAQSSTSLEIDGETVGLPPVQIRAQAIGGALSVQLATAGSDEGKGNELNFNFVMDDVDDPANLAGASWHFAADNSARSEMLNEISLGGRSIVLEPLEVTIIFSRDANGDALLIDGQFNWFEPADAETAKKTVAVSGRIGVSFPR
jgi:hypothetical protein